MREYTTSISRPQSLAKDLDREFKTHFCQIVTGVFEPVLAKHSKNFSLQNALSIGVDSMQRNFKPMVESVERWQAAQLSDVSARLISTACSSRPSWRHPGPQGPRSVLQPHY